MIFGNKEEAERAAKVLAKRAGIARARVILTGCGWAIILISVRRAA